MTSECIVLAPHTKGRARGQASGYRAVFIKAGGVIPPGWDLHHTCENVTCSNVEHLVPVPPSEHRRLHRRKKCQRGHDLTKEENVYIRPDTGARMCRPCHLARAREQTRRRHAA